MPSAVILASNDCQPDPAASKVGRRHLRDGPGTTGDGLLARLAVPDANSCALYGVLSAEGADVAGVLGDFHLLHLLTQGGTISEGIGQFVVFSLSRTVSAWKFRRGSRLRRVSRTWYHIY